MLLFRLVPGGIGVISGHGLCKFGGVGAEVLFVNCSGFIDNESHHARGAVLRRIGHERESSRHLPVDDIVLRSARGMRSLASKDPEKIAMERDRIETVDRGFCLRTGDEGIDRAIKLVVSAVPVQTVVPALIADQFLRKLSRESARRAREIFLLRIDQGAARIHSSKFIFAYATE